MSIGEAWADALPPTNKESAFALLDAWHKAGGVSIDTSNHYQVSCWTLASSSGTSLIPFKDEQSEAWIGEWMVARGNRDHMVISTKFTST
jgi:aryl-alcohol dehydrogenase-like predicted oxidoreductase